MKSSCEQCFSLREKTLKIQTYKALSYCYNWLSFLFQKEEAKSIQAIYLFGSAVRGSLEKKSDIDIFIECTAKDEERVRHGTESSIVTFSVSKDYQKWKLFHFTYPLCVQVGQLKEWDLQLSIRSEGILLYNKQGPSGFGKRKVLFIINYPKKKKDYIRIRRILFGRDEEYYRGTGIISANNSEKLSSNIFIVPQDEQVKIMDLLNKEKVTFSMKEIVEVEES